MHRPNTAAPASIFPSIVGAMFPRYWNATPVTLLNRPLFRWVLLVLCGAVVYAAAALVFEPFLAPDQQWLVVPALFAAVATAFVMAVWLVGFSLAMLDPDRLSRHLRDIAVHDRKADTARQAFNDLCRLIRGLKEAERPTAAQHAIEYLAEIRRDRSEVLGADEIGFAARVLHQCRDAWAEAARPSPSIGRALAAAEATRVTLGLAEDDRNV